MKKTTLSLFILSLAIFQGCSSNSGNNKLRGPNGKKDAPTSVETMNVSEQTIARQVRSYGTVKAEDVVEVMPQVSNRITKIYADLGDTVHQGQALAKIYQATFSDQVQQAKAQMQQNKAAFTRDSADYFRQKKLYKRDLISKSTLDQARATYESSKSQLASSKSALSQQQENLNNSVIQAPVYGVVTARNVAQGDLATSGQAAFEIANLTGYQIRVHLPREEWNKIKLGQKAQFELSDDEPSSAVGRVSHISPQLDPTTGLGEVVITFTKKGKDISQGMLVQAIINIEKHAHAIVVPRSALVENVQTVIQPESNTIQTQRSYAAFVVQGDTLALKHKLKLGIEQGNKVEVAQGLQPGDQIVTTGQANLQDSSRVKIANGNMFQRKSIPIGQGRKKARRDSAKTSASDTSSAQSN